MSAAGPPKERRILVVGNRAVGKTSLVHRFTKKTFSDAYYPTIENTTDVEMEYNSAMYKTEVIDAAGMDAYTDLNTSHYVGKQVGIMLVYTMTADQGLRKIDDIREKILAFTDFPKENAPFVLVANKDDMVTDDVREKGEKEGRDYAALHKCEFVTTSAKSGINVEMAFQKVMAAMVKAYEDPQKKEQPAKGCTIM